MKDYERRLLNHLQQDDVPSDVLLSNVKNGLGTVAYAVGNPLTKTEITLNIRLIFTTWPLIEVPPAALLPAEQVSIPVYILGLTDFYGGFLKLNTLIPPVNPWVYAQAANTCGIQGRDVFMGFPPLNPVNGDLILRYNSILSINRAYVIVHCENVAYGTFLNSFVSDLITIDTIRYIVPLANINQFINPVIVGVQTLFGKTYTDNLDPRLYITSKDFQQQICDLPINLPIDKSIMMGFQLDVFCQQVSWVLFVKKVEALTHR